MLARCYAQLTGTRLSGGDALWGQLSNKKATAICLELLDQTKLNSQGVIDTKVMVQKRILKQFNDFHRDWLPKQFQDPYELGDSMYGTVDIQDPTESALFFTRALFTDGVHVQNTLRGFEALEAIRDPSTATDLGSPSGFKRASRAHFGASDGDGSFDWNSQSLVLGTSVFSDMPPYTSSPAALLQVGTLLGIRTRTEATTIDRLFTRHGPTGATLNESGLNTPHDLRKNHGGGALGTQGLLLYNFGYGFSFVNNGTNSMPRTWISQAMKSFLCKDGPYLMPSDVRSFLSTGQNVSAFRGQTSCLQCHATLDPAAMTARNLVPATTSVLLSTLARSTASVANYNVNAGPEPGQEFWPTKPVANFRFQTPQGRLYFRSYTGNLIDKQVSNLNQLGIALSETDDFYACVSKRYVEYFTGVKVPLQDSGERSNGDPLFQQEVAWRDFIIALGKELRQTGSIKMMIKQILESDHYQTSDFGR